jgi:diguanylate cyclase (GGDEF)-like protein
MRMAFPGTTHRDLHDKTQTSLDVVLRCFVAATRADSGVVLIRNGEGKAELAAASGFAARRAAEPWTNGTFLGGALRTPGVALQPASGFGEPTERDSWRAVASRIEGPDGPIGALWAGFERPSYIARDELIRITSAYANIVSLCMSKNGDSLSGVLRSSGVDDLTGCLRYERVLEMLRAEVQRSARQGHKLSCCFFDLDHFKAINDVYGHIQGNRVLASAGEALLASARSFDCVGRFGGDEFIIVMPETPLKAAQIAAARMRIALATSVEISTGLSVTASVGVAEWNRKVSMLELLEAADQALQRHKGTGSTGSERDPSPRRPARALLQLVVPGSRFKT